jgi:nitrate/TMAO reductase-like tetraheme cytochrome c subunit
MKKTDNAFASPPFPWLPVLLAVAAFGILLTAGGFAFAANQEQHDSFCASCHSHPETDYALRSTAGQASDLASYHTGQKVNCIDCHSGQGVIGRVQAELMGAKNAFKWYTGTAQQPAVQTVPVDNQNCVKCHQDVTQRGFQPKESITVNTGEREGEREGHDNHWHVMLARWQQVSGNAATCSSCHNGHNTDGSAKSGYMVDQAVKAECEACHQVLRREE